MARVVFPPSLHLVDACGITTCNGEQIITVKDNGLVSEWAFSRGVRCRVFNQANLTKLKGYYGLGHVPLSYCWLS